jgi:hypothetical protein
VLIIKALSGARKGPKCRVKHLIGRVLDGSRMHLIKVTNPPNNDCLGSRRCELVCYEGLDHPANIQSRRGAFKSDERYPAGWILMRDLHGGGQSHANVVQRTSRMTSAQAPTSSARSMQLGI